MEEVIDNIFRIRPGDIMQVFEGEKWIDLGEIKDKRAVAVALLRANYKLTNMPVRVIRRIVLELSNDPDGYYLK